MKVEKTIELEDGHKIEFGKSTWDENAISLRNRYPTSNGGFSPRSSSEIPIQDLKVIMEETVKNGYISNEGLIELAEICIAALKHKSYLIKQNDKVDLMKQASSDPLYLQDIEEAGQDFINIDFEI